MIMERGDEDMEVDVPMQQDDESIRTKMSNSWRIEMNLTLNKYQIKSFYLFKKLLLLQNKLATRYQQV
jgi:hypothetical protein